MVCGVCGLYWGTCYGLGFLAMVEVVFGLLYFSFLAVSLVFLRVKAVEGACTSLARYNCSAAAQLARKRGCPEPMQQYAVYRVLPAWYVRRRVWAGGAVVFVCCVWYVRGLMVKK